MKNIAGIKKISIIIKKNILGWLLVCKNNNKGYNYGIKGIIIDKIIENSTGAHL